MKQPEMEHVQLCDLLIGRMLRLNANQYLERALAAEQLGWPEKEVDVRLSQAEHMEWIADKAERGVVLFGGRFNRCGYQPAEDCPREWRRSKEWSDVLP